MTIALAQGPQQSNTLSFSLASPTVAGNCLVICVSSFAASGTVTGITLGGSAGNFTQADGSLTGGAGTWIWYDWNCAGGQTAIVVSGTLNVGAGQGLIVAFEVSGLLAAAAVLDQHVSNAANSATFDSGVTPVTAQASEIWFGCTECNSVVTAFPGAPWSNSTQTFSGAGYQITSAAGAAQYTGTQTSAGIFSATAATFKAAPPPAAAATRQQQQSGRSMLRKRLSYADV